MTVRPARIVIAHSRADIVSGAEHAIADTLDLHGEAYEYVMLTPGKGILADYYRSRGFTVWTTEVETKRRLYPGLHTVGSWFFSRKLRQERIRAVVCNTFAAAARMKTACRMGNVPWAIYVREYVIDKPLHRRILGEAGMVFAVSQDLAGYLSTFVDSNRIHVAYDHIEAEQLHERAQKHRSAGTRKRPFGPDHPIVGYVGRITKYKQPDLFVRAIPGVLARIPEARFIVVGAASAMERDYGSSLPRIAKELGIEDRVAFLGHRTDAVEVLSEMSVCCVPSDREPFPRTVLEAQLLGVPVVAADSGGCPEMVRDGRSGILFSSTAPDAAGQLATAITKVLLDDALAHSLAAHAREDVLGGVASPQPIQHFEGLLTSLCGMEG